MKRRSLWWLVAVALVAFSLPAAAQSDLDQKIDSNIQDWVGTYKHLHANPELSTQEKETSALVAGTLRKLSYQVTEHFGQYEEPGLTSYGVVAVLKNGPGPTVYVRTDMDALPVKENTGLPYASKATASQAGREVGVMHACGHDLHMTVFMGTAKMLAESKGQWSGTVVMIGQPAEEIIGGAAAMLRAGLFEKFPKPDYVLALHDSPVLPVGEVAWHEGPMLAGSDSVDITIRGFGGHGAAHDHVRDGKPSAGTQNAERLAQDAAFVRRKIDHAIRDHNVNRSFRQRNVLDLSFEVLHILRAGLPLVFARQREHFVRHVQAISFARRPDPLRRKQNINASARAQIEHVLSRRQLGESGRIAAAQGRRDCLLRQAGRFARAVEVGRNWIAARGCAGVAAASG